MSKNTRMTGGSFPRPPFESDASIGREVKAPPLPASLLSPGNTLDPNKTFVVDPNTIHNSNPVTRIPDYANAFGLGKPGEPRPKAK